MDDPVTILLATGLVALALALFAWLADRRRMRRRNLDAVGIMPWAAIFFWALLVACVALGVVARGWLAGWRP